MPQGALYQRQRGIPNLVVPTIASVVGCGGTGFWTAVFLAMSGVEELILVDPDKIELSNLNRLPVDDVRVGATKTSAVSDFIFQIRKNTRIELHEKRIEKPEDCTVLRGTIFCCTDNLKSQQLICAYCKKNHLKYQRIGYDGTILNVSRAFPLSFQPATDEGGYTTTPSWVVPAAVAAGLGVFSRLCRELCVMDEVGKLCIAKCSFIPERIKDDIREEEKELILEDITDYLPDGYGYCYDCDNIDPSNGDYGYCPDCERISPDDDEYGYCPDCSRPTEDDLSEAKEESREVGFSDAVDCIDDNEIKDTNLKAALDNWLEAQIEAIRQGDAPTELVYEIENAIKDWEKARRERYRAPAAVAGS